MLDGGEVLLLGELDVLDGDVVLLVDPGATLAVGDMPERSDPDRRILGLRQVRAVRQVTGGNRGVPAGLEGGVGGHLACGGSGDQKAGRAVLAGNEGGNGGIVDRARAVM